MSYADLPTDVRMAAESILTRKQLTVLRLAANGMGTAKIAAYMEISEPVARRHKERAIQKIQIHLEKEIAV